MLTAYIAVTAVYDGKKEVGDGGCAADDDENEDMVMKT